VKIKIVSDGTPSGTQVVNEATGEKLERITAIEWRISTNNFAEAIITFRNIPIETVGFRDEEEGRRVVLSTGIKRDHKRRIELETKEEKNDIGTL
jgi:hypothetical protein